MTEPEPQPARPGFIRCPECEAFYDSDEVLIGRTCSTCKPDPWPLPSGWIPDPGVPSPELPPVRPYRLDGHPVVRIDPTGGGGPWVCTPSYARDMAALLYGAAVAVEAMNENDEMTA